MPRKLTVEITSDLAPSEYTDLGNALWMFMRSTRHDFEIQPDRAADPDEMNAAWEQYGRDAQW